MSTKSSWSATRQTPTHRLVSTTSCEVFESVADMDLTPADMRLFRDTAQKLNTAWRTVVAPRYGWHYVDVTAGFLGHGYCSKGGRFFVQCEESLKNQGDVDGMLHPNADGHAIYEKQIQDALQRSLIVLKEASAPQPGDVALPDEGVVSKGQKGIIVNLKNSSQIAIAEDPEGD